MKHKLGSITIVSLVFLIGLTQMPAYGDQGAQIKWSTYDEALRSPDKSRKFFVYFFSEGCGYCRMLENKTFSDQEIIDYINTNYTPVRVNIGGETKVASTFGVSAVPDLRFLTAEGEGIARWPGYIEKAQLAPLLKYIHTNSYKDMSFRDFLKKQK